MQIGEITVIIKIWIYFRFSSGICGCMN